MSQWNDEEILLELSYLFVLFHYSWKHIVLSFPLSNAHLLERLGIAEDTISLHSLALITHHIALDFSLVLCFSWFDYCCYIFTYLPFRVVRMLLFILLLHLSSHFYLSTAHEDIMLNRGIYPANSFNTQGLSYLIDEFLFFIVVKNLKSIHISILWWLIYSFYVQSYSLWIVWVLAIIAIEITNSLSHTVISLPLINESLNFIKVHKTDKVYMAISLTI